MTKARDLANASTALSAVSATELAFVDGVTSAIQTQLDAKVSTAGGSTVTVASGTTVPLTIQNNGTGNSLVVNDEASDTTNFVVDASGNTTINTIAAGTTTTGAVGGGYMGLPQNSATTGSYGVVAADAGKHIYSTATRTITIPANSSVALPVGTAITFVAGSGATVTIAITTDTMYLAGPGTTGSRTLAAFGMATALKIASTTWIISGNGLT